MRAGVDAVAVGRGTVVSDDPELTVRDAEPPRRQPTRVVFDSSLSISTEARLVRSAREVPTIVVSGPSPDPARREALEKRGVSILPAPDLRHALALLRELDIRSLMLEGGPRLAGAFLAAGMVDRIAVFTAPMELGPDAPRALAFAPAGLVESLARAPIVRSARFDEDSLTVRALT